MDVGLVTDTEQLMLKVHERRNSGHFVQPVKTPLQVTICCRFDALNLIRDGELRCFSLRTARSELSSLWREGRIHASERQLR